MPQYLVAVDMGPRRARAVVLEATFRSAKLVSAHAIELDPETDLAEMKWRKLRKVLPKEIDSVIANIDASAASTRLVTFPFEDQRKVDAALSFELESQVPYDLDEMGIASLVVEKGGGGSSLLAAVTPRERLEEQIRNMRAADLEPRSMVMANATLAELVAADTQEPVAVVSLGETETHVAVVHEGLRFARTVRAGGINVDRSLAKRYNLDLDEAKHAKETEARILGEEDRDSDEARAISDAVTAGMGAVVRGLTTTFKALPPDHAPRKILLTGGSSRLPGVAEHLAKRFGIPVELVDLQAALGEVGSEPSLGPEYADAVAMAIASLRRGGGVPLNFRHGDFAYHGDLQVYRGEMTRIGIGLAAVFLLAIAGSVLRFGLISAEEGRLDVGFGEASQRIIGKEVRDPMRLLSILRSGGADADGFVLPTYSATDVFEMLSMTIDSRMDITFDELDIRVNGRPDDPDRINAKGEAADFETAERVATKLKGHPCVTEAEIKDQHKQRNSSRVGFKLNARVSCPPGVEPTVELEVAAADEGKPEVP
jgi:general secretion pathway protein L